MEWRCLAMLLLVLGLLMLGGGGWCEGCLEEERLALSRLKLFFPFIDYTVGRPGLNYFYYDVGEDYDSVEGKESSIDCCKWGRVECNPTTGRVTKLFLDGTHMEFNFDGWHLNVSLFLPFQELQSLYLSGNDIAGCVAHQELNTLKNLNELELGYNKIESLGSSFQDKGQLKLNKLESLYLGFNKLRGPVDVKDLNVLTNLEELILWSNGITEVVPSQELRLMNLSFLDLIDNPLDNSKLSSLGRLSNLKILSFGSTELKISINITEIDGLRNLEELDVYCSSDIDCSFSLRSLDLFPSLKALNLIGFNFNGTNSYSQNNSFRLRNLETLCIYESSLGNNFLQKIGAMPSLKILTLVDCELNGTLHSQGFCGLTNLRELDMEGNNLKGTIPPCLMITTLNETSQEYVRYVTTVARAPPRSLLSG
ncbi:hypothetical protein V6N13_144657 [Hibiscus sabdariffa]